MTILDLNVARFAVEPVPEPEQSDDYGGTKARRSGHSNISFLNPDKVSK